MRAEGELPQRGKRSRPGASAPPGQSNRVSGRAGAGLVPARVSGVPPLGLGGRPRGPPLQGAWPAGGASRQTLTRRGGACPRPRHLCPAAGFGRAATRAAPTGRMADGRPLVKRRHVGAGLVPAHGPRHLCPAAGVGRAATRAAPTGRMAGGRRLSSNADTQGRVPTPARRRRDYSICLSS